MLKKADEGLSKEAWQVLLLGKLDRLIELVQVIADSQLGLDSWDLDWDEEDSDLSLDFLGKREE